MSLPVYDSTKHHIGLAEVAEGEITVDELNVASATAAFGGGANPSFTVPTENEVAPGARLFVSVALDTGGASSTDATVSIAGLTFVELFDGSDVTHGHHGVAGYFDCPDGLPVGTDIDFVAADGICWGWSLVASSFLATYGFEDETAVDTNTSGNAGTWSSDATVVGGPALIVSLIGSKEGLTETPDAGTVEANEQSGAFASAMIAYRIEADAGSYTLSGTLSGTSFGLSVVTQAFAAAPSPMRGLIIAGGYTRSPQRFGASPKYGGDQDQLEPTALSRWTQDDFSGGAYQEAVGEDVARFSTSRNFLPSLVEKSARTVPPLVRFVGAGAVAADTSIGVFATGGKQIAVADSDRIRFYNAVTGEKIEQVDPTHTIKAAAHDPADNRVYVITLRNSDSRPHLRRIKNDETVNIAAFPDTAPLACHGMIVTAGRDILAAMGTTLYLADINDARDDATFTRIGRLPGIWQDAVTYNGQTYILLTDGEQATAVVSWDGTQILPVTDIPYNFLGSCIGTYGGRLYVGGRGRDLSDNDVYAELYEITGASLRLVQTYSGEARLGETCPTNIFSMAVHEGLLFLGTDQGELLAYDLTRDALWPGIEIFSPNDHVLEARYLTSTRQRLIAWCYDKTRVVDEDGFYRLAPTDGDLDGTNGDNDATPYTCFVETSDFATEPDREKRWSQLRVLTRYSPAPTLEYSIDGGATWTSLAATTSSGAAGLVKSDFDLSSVGSSESIRFRFSFTKSVVAYTELIAFTCSFIMLDSGKQAWSFSLLGAENPENLDGTYPEQDVLALRTALWGYWEDKTTLSFRDQDGTDRTVFLSDLNETQPVIGEALDANGTREAFFSVTLTEL